VNARSAPSAGDLKPAGAVLPLTEHPLRTALLELMGRIGSVTANEAGRRLGRSSGLCSFHLRQLGRAGLIEEVPQCGGVSRPWRLRAVADRPTPASATASVTATVPDSVGEQPDNPFSSLNRGLENESYQRWLTEREQAPELWRRDDAFSTVLYLTPEEIDLLGGELRRLLDPYRIRESLPSTRPADAAPVAVVNRIFPILPSEPEPEPTDDDGDCDCDCDGR
jgi:Helix-turn-helix domain